MKAPLRGDALLALGALGIVFGDIGTSPLYAMHAVLSHNIIPRTPEAITGIISLVFWALITVVSVKYIVLLLSADNDGDGGILALFALLSRSVTGRLSFFMTGAGIVGAGLFYGDGIITPAISVLSAAEGLTSISPALEHAVIPLSAAAVIALFAAQRFGTGRVGSLFGPIMLAWFLGLAALGLPHIFAGPSILAALLPHSGLMFAIHSPLPAFIAVGAVVLVITGAEALYADLGHFGPYPIRLAWFAIALPCLTINYLGQGALLLTKSEDIGNPFFAMVPSWAQIPAVALAACAAVIASQSVISGIFSMTRQAERLGLLPHIQAIQTSQWVRGQIYMPTVNRLLCIGVVSLIVAFGSSTRLANAYGLAVTSTLILTSALLLVYMHTVRGWRIWVVCLYGFSILAIELVFFSAGIIKVFAGGWIPLIIAAFASTIMLVWRKGRRLLNEQHRELADSPEHLLRRTEFRVVPGTAVYPHLDHQTAASSLSVSAHVFNALHERIITVSVETLPQPHVRIDDRYTVRSTFRSAYPIRFDDVSIRRGFNDDIDLPAALEEAARQHLLPPAEKPWYIISEAHFTPFGTGMMVNWQRALFIVLYRNSERPTARYHLPREQTLTIGISAAL